ncbi:MAG: HAMP domain-containing protein [Polyangiaceae bacterium]|nr:HAMP domain-containing protein [Polyangiaceae bacterium]
MRLGLRLQILLLLGGLLLLAFVPLHYAIATYSGVAVKRLRESSARALGRAVAGRLAEARAHRGPHQLSSLIESQFGVEGVEAVGFYDPNGGAMLRAGDPESVATLPAFLAPGREAVLEVSGPHGRALAIVVPETEGAVAVVVRTDTGGTPLTPLVRLFGLYATVVGLALLVAAYFALTRLIVHPLDAIGRAAERVAGGARRFEVAPQGPRELVELAQALRVMTERLLANEDTLQGKVSELSAATRKLEEAHARLVRSERLASVGRLAAGLAHEVGNPIAAMLGLLELLLAGGLSPEEERDFLNRLRRETERINGILRDLLAFARPTVPRPDVPLEPGDVRLAVEEVSSLLAPQSALREVTLTIELGADLPPVLLSREQLVQVILNLVLNAADACGPGGTITLRGQARARSAVEAGSVGLTSPGSRPVVIEVEDDGPGVDPAIRARLFEPFATTKDTGKGTGLGLAVCRGLVESAGGTIVLDPRSTGGACFVIELPTA